MKEFRKKLKGYGLVELVLAIGIFAAIASTLVLIVVDSTRTLDNTRARSRASYLTQEINSAIIMMKSKSWFSVIVHTNDGPKYIEYVDGDYQIQSGQGVKSGFTYSFEILPANRDEHGYLVDTGGTVDPHTRLVQIDIQWTDFLGRSNSISPKIYINDWETNSIVYSTEEDFIQGEHDSTMVQNQFGGEVRLQSMFYADWCNPSLSMTAHDLPGQGIASNISSSGEHVYMGTGGNSSGISFMKATVTGDPPIVTVEGTVDGYKVNDVFGLNGIALMATDNPSKEVVIFNISSTPYTEIGYFDGAGPQDATTVFVYGDKGFVTHGRTVSIFNLTSFTGSRSLIRSIDFGTRNAHTATDIFVDERYIYMTLTSHTYEFVIYEYNDSGIYLRAFADLNDANGTGLYISEDKTRAYISTARNIGHEFFILDITNKNGALPVISSFDTGDMSPNSVASIDNRAIIAGASGEEYQVLDITDEQVPIRCGGLQINTGVNALALVTQGINHYTYVVTRDSNSEFKIIRGGPGGGGADGNGYLPFGIHVSPIHDSESYNSIYYFLGLTTIVPEGTSLQIQFRVSDDPNMSGSTWVGPDGTASTYYELSGMYTLPTNLQGRYIQYRAVFESDTVSTPLLQEIIINYEK
jgi:type II secretory pathway pseudopilin PulG